MNMYTNCTLLFRLQGIEQIHAEGYSYFPSILICVLNALKPARLYSVKTYDHGGLSHGVVGQRGLGLGRVQLGYIV